MKQHITRIYSEKVSTNGLVSVIKNGGGLFPFSEKFREEQKRMSGELHRIRIWHGREQSYVQVGTIFPLQLALACACDTT